jgi:coenzyme F420-reducing hydrogenase beta subunit
MCHWGIGETLNSNVVTEIVDNDICIGCGTCVAMCKKGALEIKFNKYGEYNPYFNKKNMCENCGYCLNFCPFFNENDNEDDMSFKIFDEKENLKYSRFLGYYIDNYVGYSCVDDQRKNGASGGIATWVLETALIKKLVDYVVCVSSNNDPEKLFDYNIYSDTSNIRRSSSSAYYPINLSNVLKNILDKEGRYFVIGPPCFIKSIRLAMQNNPKINSRITFLGGLVCGQLKNKNFANNLALHVGMHDKISYVNFRVKDYKNPPNNYYYYFEDINNKNKKFNRFEDKFSTFNNRWFTPNACNFCDDIFAECSDITFMDAWLKDYIGDSKGNSIVLIRSNRLNNLIREGIQNQELRLKKLSLDDVIKAQIDNIDFKRNGLKYRLYLANKYDKINPEKRVSPSNKLNIFDKWSIINKNQLQKKSKLLFDKYVTNKNRYYTFLKKIRKYHNRELFRIYVEKRSKSLLSLLKKMIM